MAAPLNDLRRELSNALKSVWRNLPATAPEADALNEDVVRDRAQLHHRPRRTISPSTRTPPAPLPVLARLKPRGLFEDDWRARPTTKRPWPVILVHGTGATKGDWQQLGGDLRRDGWAVFAAEFGNRATGSVHTSRSRSAPMWTPCSP